MKYTNRFLLAFLILTAPFLKGCSTPGMSFSDFINPDSKYQVQEIDKALVDKMTAEDLNRFKALTENKDLKLNQDTYEYKIGVGDLLIIKFWESTDVGFLPNQNIVTKEQAGTLVDGKGNIYFPYLGEVNVADKTVSEVRKMLTSKVSRFFTNPRLDVNVLEFRSQKAIVSGEVAKAGNLALSHEPLYVLSAIEKAGGLLPTADLENAEIRRANGIKEKVNLMALINYGNAKENKILYSNDTLYIPDNHRNKVFMMGEVLQPNAQTIKAGKLSLAEVIMNARGVDNVTADASNIYVVRGAVSDFIVASGEQNDVNKNQPTVKTESSPEKVRIYRLNMKSPEAVAVADRFNLHPRDVVFVSTSGVTQWNRVISQLIPSAVTNTVNSRRFD